MMIKNDYVAPEVEIIQVAVEKGFAVTSGYDGGEDGGPTTDIPGGWG